MRHVHKRRLLIIILILGIVTSSAFLILYALKQNINLFYTPTQLLNTPLNNKQIVRIGGYVKKNSVSYSTTGTEVSFVVTDRKTDLKIFYKGILPNLFREGQTVIVTGIIKQNIFIAQDVLAKHDENYIPKPLQIYKKTGSSYVA